MLRWVKIGIAAVMMAGLAGSLLAAQDAQFQEKMREMGEARDRARAQLRERFFELAQLTNSEKAAAQKAMEAKEEARNKLSEQLTRLRATAIKTDATKTELSAALAAYRGALAQYRKKVEMEDKILCAKLSLGAQARGLSLGILENGFGGIGRSAFGPSRRPEAPPGPPVPRPAPQPAPETQK